MKTSEAIESLERRADFLAQKIANEESKPLHRERQELSAIKMALKELELRQNSPGLNPPEYELPRRFQ